MPQIENPVHEPPDPRLEPKDHERKSPPKPHQGHTPIFRPSEQRQTEAIAEQRQTEAIDSGADLQHRAQERIKSESSHVTGAGETSTNGHDEDYINVDGFDDQINDR